MTRLLGVGSTEGRRFIAGRGNDAGAARPGFLDRLAPVGPDPKGRAASPSTAADTLAVFETWPDGWSDMR